MGRRVLVVDDSLTVRMDICEALQAAGFHTIPCPDLQSARLALESDDIALVVLDLQLPDGSGLDLVSDLRSAQATVMIPVLILANDSDDSHRPRNSRPQLEEYVGKPYDLARIVARTRALTLGLKRLLAVDDSRTQLEELAGQLREEGYEVMLAASGEEALAVLAAEPVDCILLDLVMPGMSGEDTCRRIKEHATWRDIPLIILTARDDRDAMIEVMNAGADDYIAKSADFDILKARLRAQLRRKHFEDENRRMLEALVRRESEATARKQMEPEQRKINQRLRDHQFYTRSLIESNIDALVTTDPRGIITDVNTQMEALTGCTRDELIGAPVKNYFTDPVRAERAITLVLQQKTVKDYELTACDRDGNTTEVSWNATTIYDRHRRLQGVFAAARDVTELRRNERALQETNVALESAKLAAEQASRAKSDFLVVMGDEFRGPLNAICGLAQTMKSSHSLTADGQRESAAQILQVSQHLLQLIADNVDLAAIDAGQVTIAEPSPMPDR